MARHLRFRGRGRDGKGRAPERKSAMMQLLAWLELRRAVEDEEDVSQLDVVCARAQRQESVITPFSGAETDGLRRIWHRLVRRPHLPGNPLANSQWMGQLQTIQSTTATPWLALLLLLADLEMLRLPADSPHARQRSTGNRCIPNNAIAA